MSTDTTPSAENPEKKFTAIKDLPIYEDDKSSLKPETYKFVEDDPLPLQKQCFQFRKKFVEQYDIFAQKFKPIDKLIGSVKHNIQYANSYLRSDEASVLPKAAAISVGGMAGFLLSLRRHGRIRKIVYPITGLLVMSTFCYPNETIDFIQIGLAHSERTWNNFKKC